MNIVHIAGRLGVDPEVRFTSNGQKVTTLRVASNTRKAQKDETIWWRVTVWGENFDKMISFLKKGSAIIVVGELMKPEIFNDREGNPQVSMGITASNIMFSPFGRSDQKDSKNTNNNSNSGQQQNNSQDEEYAGFSQGQKQESESQEFSDDEIPF
ncbi:MAG: single-stranded DNA-binding protein [Parachlamydiales bacterium]|nr:single-stranded DNA-binding protein [Parachlamydiales bacterium]